MATSTISFSSWKTNSGTLNAEAPLLSAGDSSLANIIPNYSALHNVTLSFQWRTDKSLTAGDCWVYAGSSEWHGETNAKNSWVTVTCDKNNLSSILSFFNSATQKVGTPNDRIYIKFKASIMRNFYIQNASLVADYTPSAFLVDVLADEGGYVSGTGDYTVSTSGTTFTISADPYSGYKFVRWSDGNTEASRTITLYESQATGFQTLITYTAYFEKEKYTITANASDGGTVTGGGIYSYLDTATLTAIPDPGYRFVKWSDEDTSNPRTITVTRNATYTAIFEKITFTATFKNYDGSVLQTVSVEHGDTPNYTGSTPTKSSTAEYSYSFSGWSPSIGAITSDTIYIAQFTATKRKYTINTSASNGVVSGGGTYEYGTSITLIVSPADGYKFEKWSDGNTQNPRVITVTGNATYEAQFRRLVLKFKTVKIYYPSENDIASPTNPLVSGEKAQIVVQVALE